MFVKTAIKNALLGCGYYVRRVPELGYDPFADMQRLTTSASPLILDVGANIGQSVQEFLSCFKAPEIHSFEPGEETFKALRRNTHGLPRVHLVNSGMGACCEVKTFVENSSSDMSSFFEPGTEVVTPVTGRRPIQLDTIDDYCGRAGIEHIDILKSDTQGYDLEVLRGARRMLGERRIDLIFLELIFSKMYIGSPRFDDTYSFLSDNGMSIVSFYDMHYYQNSLSWTNALFRLAS